MLNFKTFSIAFMISSCLLSITVSSPTFAMEDEGETKTPRKSLPSFEEFDEGGEFFRYSRTLENNIEWEIKNAEKSDPILKNISEELNAIEIRQRLLRAWITPNLEEYMGVVKKYEKELLSVGINIYDVPSSLNLRKL